MFANDFIAADFINITGERFSFFNHMRGIYTWIDHVLTSSYNVPNVKSCYIVPEEALNASDHLPIRISFDVSLERYGSDGKSVLLGSRRHNGQLKRNGFAIPDWSNEQKRELFRDILKEKLTLLDPIVINNGVQGDEIQAVVDGYTDNLTNAIHCAVKDAGCLPHQHFRPRPYWCPELTLLRDCKRFWFNIWAQAGKPRCGELFKCYKGVKKLFRQRSRYYIDNQQLSYYSRLDSLYRHKKFSLFWNRIKKQKSKVNSSLSEYQFATHYNGIMNEVAPLSDSHPEEHTGSSKVIF